MTMYNIFHLIYKHYHCFNYSSNKSNKIINVYFYLIETLTLIKNRKINVHTNINLTTPRYMHSYSSVKKSTPKLADLEIPASKNMHFSTRLNGLHLQDFYAP